MRKSNKKRIKNLNTRSFISSLFIGNFKAFKDQNEIKFAPMINLVFGKNSSGKSTINQALRLFRQSYGLNKLTPFNYESPTELRGKGGLDIDVGYQGLAYNGNKKSNISLGVETGRYSKDEKKILNGKKSIKYNYKYIKNFYTGKNLVRENTILNEIYYSNEGGEAKITLPSYKFFEDKTPLGEAIREGEKYHTGEFFIPRVRKKQDDSIYKSVYHPYYYKTIFKPSLLKINSIEDSFNLIKNIDNNIFKNFFTDYLNHLQKKIKTVKKNKKLPAVPDFMTHRRSLEPINREIGKIREKCRGDLKKQINLFSEKYEMVFKLYDDEFLEFDERGKKQISDLKVYLNQIKKLKIFFSKLKINQEKFLDFFKKDICLQSKNIIFFNGYFMKLPNIKNKDRSPWREQRENNYLINILNFLISPNIRGRKNVDIFNAYSSRFGSANSSLGSIDEVMNKFLVAPGLRQIPKRYFVKGLQTDYVGPSAENLGELLANPEINKATNRWFEKLEIPYKVEIQKSGNYYEIVFVPKNSKIKISSMHVGLGYPLILPFIVQCIIAKNKVILIEEPEVHLHPKIEADLADLITESSKERNNQFIIETHSEDFLLRILKSIRQEKLKPEDVSVNYITPSFQGGSKINKININKFGQYTTPWHDNLFAERRREFSNK